MRSPGRSSHKSLSARPASGRPFVPHAARWQQLQRQARLSLSRGVLDDTAAAAEVCLASSGSTRHPRSDDGSDSSAGGSAGQATFLFPPICLKARETAR